MQHKSADGGALCPAPIIAGHPHPYLGDLLAGKRLWRKPGPGQDQGLNYPRGSVPLVSWRVGHVKTSPLPCVTSSVICSLIGSAYFATCPSRTGILKYP
jgi:hypothetical protein